ncbi:Repair endonuclease XPF [Acidilobus saccharovorans 345-15]|uniref:Repair endonuclease XPF n=1 Tax=Acidilobus saccharovorans (strain DSM 16705 / JCM 18335 / VKM B-2471 / 345-15) TaxID=666510 RepID=D9Q0F5_ACIS3|nr:Repair endonuclease XPF [Acidilobus saccharovorans 345-15]
MPVVEGSATKRTRVYADVREEASGVPSLLESLGVLVIRKQLPEGDYIIPPDIVVERKNAKDFVSSLFDGRLFDQASRMRNDYEEVFYIIEGDFSRELRYWSDKERQLIGALATLVASYNVKLLWSGSARQTAEYLASLASKYLTKGRGSRPVIINKKPSAQSLREWQLYIVESFPGIGAKTAERILEKFGSLESFFNASLAELASVEGVGESKAARIKELLKAPFKGERRVTTLDKFYGNPAGANSSSDNDK